LSRTHFAQNELVLYVNFLFYINGKVFIVASIFGKSEFMNRQYVPSKISFALCSFVSFIVQFGYKQCYLDTRVLIFFYVRYPCTCIRYSDSYTTLDSKGYLVCLL